MNQMGRRDIAFTLMGSGDCYDELVAQRDGSACTNTSTSPAACPTTTVAQVLSTADVGLSPDPKNPLNDVSTMNKTMEYMAFGLPVVAFDLRETRVSAGRGGRLRARPTTSTSYARAIVDLDRRPATAVPRWGGWAANASSRSWRGSTSGTAYLARLRRACGPRAECQNAPPVQRPSGHMNVQRGA